jgi:hypothetical protein
MFRYVLRRIRALIPLVAVTFMVTSFAQPVSAESASGSASVENVHCSGGEGFALILLSANAGASKPVVFTIQVNDAAYGSPESVMAGDTFGVSVGQLVPGTSVNFKVFADGTKVLDQPVNIPTCVADPGGNPIVVDVVPHHPKKHHHKKHKHHKPRSYTATTMLPSVGK